MFLPQRTLPCPTLRLPSPPNKAGSQLKRCPSGGPATGRGSSNVQRLPVTGACPDADFHFERRSFPEATANLGNLGLYRLRFPGRVLLLLPFSFPLPPENKWWASPLL
jgi:hypothetical protein